MAGTLVEAAHPRQAVGGLKGCDLPGDGVGPLHDERKGVPHDHETESEPGLFRALKGCQGAGNRMLPRRHDH